jgi:hypothetical protein
MFLCLMETKGPQKKGIIYYVEKGFYLLNKLRKISKMEMDLIGFWIIEKFCKSNEFSFCVFLMFRNHYCSSNFSVSKTFFFDSRKYLINCPSCRNCF